MLFCRFALYFTLIAAPSCWALADKPKAQKPVIKMSAMQQELKGSACRTLPLPRALCSKLPHGSTRKQKGR